MRFHANSTLNIRFYDHLCLGLSRDIQLENHKNYEHKPNLIEKAGNGVLWILNSIPRTIRWGGRQFQDPRVVTVALTLSTLFLTTLAFYPAPTIAATKVAYFAIKALVLKIPVWSVKLNAYILTCGIITGFGTRATGRFANTALMKAFYGLPNNHQGNPANMTIAEIRAALAEYQRNRQQAKETDSGQAAQEKVINF